MTFTLRRQVNYFGGPTKCLYGGKGLEDPLLRGRQGGQVWRAEWFPVSFVGLWNCISSIQPVFMNIDINDRASGGARTLGKIGAQVILSPYA